MTYTVSVRSLCEFSARRGDLDFRFHLSPTGQEGSAGHRIVTGRRDEATYQKEIALEGQFGALRVRGRADGFDASLARLEEVKTYRGRLRDISACQSGLHWAQACVYGHLLCDTLQLRQLEVALVYFHLETEEETSQTRSYSATELKQHFDRLCEQFLAWAVQEAGHRQARDATLLSMSLPFTQFRDGQRSLAKGVYRCVRDRGLLAAQAPTGIGKTLGTLFPALKAAPACELDKIFFLTAKTPGRAVALQAIQTLHSRQPLALRTLELVSREHACEQPDKQCHGASCPLAAGFFDRLPAARQAAVQSPLLDQETVRRHALEHQICPYYLATELVPWCDLVVGDYNYYFGPSATLFSQTRQQEWRSAVLVDEAHNLVERARAMYSAALTFESIRTLQAGVRDDAPLDRSLARLARSWKSMSSKHAHNYCSLAEPPEPLLRALRGTCDTLSERLEHLDGATHDDALRFFFEAQHFLGLSESFGPHSLVELTDPRAGTHGQCAIRNVVPAPFLQPRFEAAHACILFSATLHPHKFYADILGLPDSTSWLNVETPFKAEQLQVKVLEVSTRYADREATLSAIVQAIARQYDAAPGNYLVFASSFDYLHRLAEAFALVAPDVPTWQQSRAMLDAERRAFLARFDASGRGIGFAVLGGLFAEGIDLPGDRLIGAFIATLGLPQVNPSNEALKRCLDGSFPGHGYDYAYLYPGLRKVVQAAGRILRDLQDRGVVYLMDSRYARPAVRRLLPPWWRIEYDRTPPNPLLTRRIDEGLSRTYGVFSGGGQLVNERRMLEAAAQKPAGAGQLEFAELEAGRHRTVY